MVMTVHMLSHAWLATLPVLLEIRHWGVESIALAVDNQLVHGNALLMIDVHIQLAGCCCAGYYQVTCTNVAVLSNSSTLLSISCNS